METKTILISGAGIGGPTLAFWLRRHGFEQTIVERAAATRPGGYAIDLRGSAMTVAERMGVLGEIRQAATGMGVMTYVDEAGETVATLPPESMSGEVEILRGDLAGILTKATPDVEYLYNDSITSVTEDPSGVDVTFEHAPARRFDLVVGADGLHSSLRSLAFGPEDGFRHDLGAYVAIFTTANYLGLDYTGVLHSVVGRTAGTYSARGNTEAKGAFFFNSPQLTYDYRDVARQKDFVSSAFAGMGWAIPTLLAGMAEADDFYFDTVSQIRMPSFARGRVALVGDAGYCASVMSGMGTSLALVGAYVLAGELAAAEGDHKRAFPVYQREMRDMIDQSQALAVNNRQWFLPSTEADIEHRTRMLAESDLATAGQYSASRAVSLKDYGLPVS